jgi:hypothetical protein
VSATPERVVYVGAEHRPDVVPAYDAATEQPPRRLSATTAYSHVVYDRATNTWGGAA